MADCLKCGAPLPEPPATGRPPVYCGPGCRRAVEYEVRRITRRLERDEDELQRLDRRLAGRLTPQQTKTIAGDMEVVRRHLAEDEARLAALLGGEQV